MSYPYISIVDEEGNSSDEIGISTILYVSLMGRTHVSLTVAYPGLLKIAMTYVKLFQKRVLAFV
jgi:hypothetical protein